MDDKDLLTIGEIARRAGLATSALRYYEGQGLVSATRTSGGQRRYRRNMLRRLAFIRAAQNVGLSLGESGRRWKLCQPNGHPPRRTGPGSPTPGVAG